jgi:integrase
MGQATITIPLVTWRNGQPRFIAGPRARRLGFAGQDLRHPNGVWFSISECEDWSDRRAAEIENAAQKTPRRRRRLAGYITVGQMLEMWLAEPRMKGVAVIKGRKQRRPLKANTVRYYRTTARLVEAFDHARVWHSPAAAITPKGAAGIIERFEVDRGLAQAHAVRATLSAAYSWAQQKGSVAHNPFKGGDLDLPTQPPRIRYGTIAEMKALVAAADAMGRPEIGDAIMLGLWTGQRQNDRLALEGGQITEAGILFRQSKKHGQPLLIRQAPELARRLAAMRARRAGWRLNYPHIILDEKARRPFEPDWYRKVYRKVREAAVDGIRAESGDWLIKPVQSLADFRDQDLRDTAVTWLALAGASKLEIASITGHSLKSIDDILKHYLGLHPDMARTAIGKLTTWYEGEAK